MEFTGPGLSARIAAAQQQADRTRLVRQADASDKVDDPASLQKAAEEFEAVFLNTLMKAMRNTVPENELFNGGGATKFYRQMHDAEMAKSLARANGGLGIADMIVRQLKRDGEGDQAQAPAVGPAAPLPLTRNVQGPAASRYTVLRRMAESHGTAAADTLKRFEPEIHAAARSAGLDPSLLLAVVLEESGGDPDALSPKGALGLMQLMPETAEELGVEDRAKPGENLRGGADYLARMIRQHDGELDRALAAYNAGPGAVQRAGGRIPDFPETRRYVQRVMDRYRALSHGTQMATE